MENKGTVTSNDLLVNRLRAILTALGIIIGVGSVIGLVSVGRGVEGFVQSEFQSLGANGFLGARSVSRIGTAHGLDGRTAKGRRRNTASEEEEEQERVTHRGAIAAAMRYAPLMRPLNRPRWFRS